MSVQFMEQLVNSLSDKHCYHEMNMPDDNSLRPSQVATHELMRLMIDQNAVRDRQINEILEQLIATRNEQPPQFSVMPDLNSTIGSFDGELADCDIAERWLTSLQTIY